MSRLAFLTCHLTGTGHLVRTLQLARAARRSGHEVMVMTGGRVLAHLDLDGLDTVQLPPVSVQGFEFSILRDDTGAPVSDAYMAGRRAAISDALVGFRADALITELFPFGRRGLAEEFMAAIDAARAANPGAKILCSIRDIPEPKPKRLAETSARLVHNYDGVLVHGDADFLPLSTTWPLVDDLVPMIHHTGYIGPAMPKGLERSGTVLVSVGGGALGRKLLGVAAQAAAGSVRAWHLLVGGADAEAEAWRLRTAHPADNLIIEPARPDFRDLLASAGCSISLCGYNTAVELAGCMTPAILVPMEEAGEAEQLIRAERLAGFPGISVMRAETLSPGPLATAAEALAMGPPRSPIPLARDDGTGAVRVIEALLA